jgi:hypothetical protein
MNTTILKQLTDAAFALVRDVLRDVVREVVVEVVDAAFARNAGSTTASTATVGTMGAEALDYDKLAEAIAGHIDVSAIAGHIDVSDIASDVAGNIDSREIARRIDVSDIASEIARNIDTSDIASNLGIDASDIAGNLDIDSAEIASNLDAEEIGRHIDAGAIAAALLDALVTRLAPKPEPVVTPEPVAARAD